MCRIRSQFYIMNKEVKGCTSSSKQQEATPEQIKTKDEIRLEDIKISLERAALEWDRFMLKEQMKSLMYVDLSLCGDTNKDKLIDELNFKECMRFKRKTTSKYFVGITVKGRKFIIHEECFDANI